MSNDATPADAASDPYQELQATPEFQQLRRKFRWFVFPMTALFLVWYFVYVLLSSFAPSFMGIKVFGNINIGLLFGLGQFVSTFAITFIYARWASREFDPLADKLGAQLDADAAARNAASKEN